MKTMLLDRYSEKKSAEYKQRKKETYRRKRRELREAEVLFGVEIPLRYLEYES